MKKKFRLFALLIAVMSIHTFSIGQQVSDAKLRSRLRADNSSFHRQILELKEFGEERKKISRLTKENHVPVKVIAVIDTDGADDNNVIKGYITQVIGENSNNVYELSFDRTTKKITSVKKTGEGDEPEAVEKKQVEKKPVAHAKPKKNKDDEDDDDADTDEDKPVKGKQKEKDDDKLP